jgi:hypothetical protein
VLLLLLRAALRLVFPEAFGRIRWSVGAGEKPAARVDEANEPAEPDAFVPESLETLLPDAEAGDPDAMLGLASLYASGDGDVSQDYGLAFHWCKRAADAGSTDAWIPLATMYRRGRGTLRDDRQALDYYLRAAGQGRTDAMVTVGWMYARGIGTQQNQQTAREWLDKVETTGGPEDLARLGEMYLAGDGVGQDLARARQLFLQAADTRPVYFDIYGLPNPWKPDPLAMIALGRMHALGQGVDPDQSVASDWFARAVQTGDPRAARVLAQMHRDGDCVEQDDAVASQLLKMAGLSGDTGEL